MDKIVTFEKLNQDQDHFLYQEQCTIRNLPVLMMILMDQSHNRCKQIFFFTKQMLGNWTKSVNCGAHGLIQKQL